MLVHLTRHCDLLPSRLGGLRGAIERRFKREELAVSVIARVGDRGFCSGSFVDTNQLDMSGNRRYRIENASLFVARNS